MTNAVLNNILTRRSVRMYRSQQLGDGALADIIEAGRCAPSGGNNQTTHFLVIQNAQVLNELKALVTREFAKMELTEGMYKSLRASILRSRAGGYDFIFGAPTLVVTANRRGYGNAMADCAVALENMMLAAWSLGIGSCWINQLRWLCDNEAICAYLQALGIREDEWVCGSLALGYPAQSAPTPPVRSGNPVTYVR